jgi:hypothetical protein
LSKTTGCEPILRCNNVRSEEFERVNFLFRFFHLTPAFNILIGHLFRQNDPALLVIFLDVVVKDMNCLMTSSANYDKLSVSTCLFYPVCFIYNLKADAFNVKGS